MPKKKEWQNPELIVLVRGKPEEAVLTSCKGAGFGVPPPGAAENYNNCSLAGCDSDCNAQEAPS